MSLLPLMTGIESMTQRHCFLFFYRRSWSRPPHCSKAGLVCRFSFSIALPFISSRCTLSTIQLPLCLLSFAQFLFHISSGAVMRHLHAVLAHPISSQTLIVCVGLLPWTIFFVPTLQLSTFIFICQVHGSSPNIHWSFCTYPKDLLAHVIHSAS